MAANDAEQNTIVKIGSTREPTMRPRPVPIGPHTLPGSIAASARERRRLTG